jgi:hypothetical protein
LSLLLLLLLLQPQVLGVAAPSTTDDTTASPTVEFNDTAAATRLDLGAKRQKGTGAKHGTSSTKNQEQDVAACLPDQLHHGATVSPHSAANSGSDDMETVRTSTLAACGSKAYHESIYRM